ncbi:glycosyltransferase [Alloprevotella sp. OH1205_COT-284]|uniref:glycosyltransferase n=1 Tax=Alloprevotella sp. OH1205_COT-284 TaxID=2491043 RepID=UPI000F5DB22A|nr:glycosyltransferase [Alloprevotella sp. OH1205_COT-284]RRD80070.1 glycosyltransferase [Alloprevotella sp. OH1205_COT-284]
MINPLAPVALFVYNRADNTEQTLRHLVANTLAGETDVYVFSDGGKDDASWAAVNEVRRLVRNFKKEAAATGALKSLTLIERPENVYLERNIIDGIAHVLKRHDTIIVLEDDICTAPHFLAFMNQAFSLYRNEPRVMHVTGFTHLSLLEEHPDMVSAENETYFTHHAGGWGWGTWRDRWQHFVHFASEAEALEGLTAEDIDRLQYGGAFPCLHSLDRTPIPWDVCWEIAVGKADGLALAPAHTLVRNIGLKQGTHFGRAFDCLQRFSYDRRPLSRPVAISYRTPAPNPQIEQLFAEAIRDWGIRYTRLGKAVRWLYKRLLKKKV